MFNSNVLEIGIGLVFTYLMLSLVVTAANELIATVCRSRARDLERGIKNLLDGNSRYPLRWWQIIAGLWSKSPVAEGEWGKAFLSHPLVDALSKTDSKPSYIPSHVFATVLMQLAQRKIANQPLTPVAGGPLVKPLNGFSSFDEIEAVIRDINSDRIRDALLPLVEVARMDMTNGVAALEKFNQQVEIWFDHTMDRVSGWYKNRTQKFLLVIAVLAAFLLNVDTIAICRELGHNDTLRAALVESAKQYTASDLQKASTGPAATQPTPEAMAQSIDHLQQQISKLDGLGLPIGWTWSDDPHKGPRWREILHDHIGLGLKTADKPADNDLRLLFHHDAMFVVTKFCGLLLTALAASLGAPFWFDTLNKLISVRGTGKPPEERPKDPKVVLQPQKP